ncbi:hypothetical protein KW798_02805 [Candidatus Parcubacteria bacterium]|nr:hypothetical protein [Candidatus Parcubacteria bacterium]
MTKNPFINALAAALYIAVVASVMFYGSNYFPKVESVLIPIAMLSLFTLSAAIMGYLFLYEPGQLVLAGEHKQAVTLFLQTVATFAGITIILFLTLFLKVV